jgi:VanZ family protein
MSSRDSQLRLAEHLITVILLGTLLVIMTFNPGRVGKIAIPVTVALLITCWISAWHRRAKRPAHAPEADNVSENSPVASFASD